MFYSPSGFGSRRVGPSLSVPSREEKTQRGAEEKRPLDLHEETSLTPFGPDRVFTKTDLLRPSTLGEREANGRRPL